jgi:Amt family ammonium transporter
VASIYLKKRSSYSTNKKPHEPANIAYVALGTGLLWFGWFGFNAGSAVSSGDLAAVAFATTNTASAAAGIAWILFDMVKGKKPSVLGMCIGAVVGLVAITPAAGFVSIPVSIFIGAIASIISNFVANLWATRTSIDDTLDVFPCHGLGGLVGTIMTGLFASQAINSAIATNGTWYNGVGLVAVNLLAACAVIVYTVIVTFIILKLVDVITPFRVDASEEAVGLDMSQHDEQILTA